MWCAKSMGAAVRGLCLGKDWTSLGRISIDTRTLRPGDIFVAIKGKNFDGHCFVPEAFSKGAVAAVVDEAYVPTADCGPLVAVKDTLQALHDIATMRLRDTRAKVIAITGSAGKTTTKYVLSGALSKYGKVYYNEANYNNLIGMPLYAANLTEDAEFVVLEMGMNSPGEVDALSRIARPDVAVITNVGPAHLEFFESVEGVLAAKLEVFNHVKDGAIAVLNFDSEHYAKMRAVADSYCARIISFGVGVGADVQIFRREEPSNSVTFRCFGEELQYNLKSGARHLAYSVAITAAVGHAFSIDLTQARGAMEEFVPLEGRGKVHVTAFKGREIVLLDDAYNANPLSMVAAIENLSNLNHARVLRRVAILGDMLELGSGSCHYHRGLLERIMHSNIDVVYTVGSHMLALYDVLPQHLRGGHFADHGEALAHLERIIKPGDGVLVKGSFATKLSLVVKHLLECPEHAT
ncbi:UDP-N-acetylmuramoyl-tripeptide--D-alanyl-D-alanine ligase [Anaplasma marginale]|nr:UDP-N-acetylmuramoyl-tripeptide--D-alanyl-D-alanine ligase [Anaplasma marginale]KAB0451262.1 UDP-N-acetylmuramoyl-tripeptide--D-alanyl-D-alanine ligase [Anaplasma marginale]